MIEPNAKRIEELLTTSVQYIIPKYQRQYEWGRDEAMEFIADINEHKGSEGDSLFLGTIIFDTTESDTNRISIVDGQQRMTTILLLLIACRQLAKRLNEFQLASLIQQKITFVDGTTGESEGTKLIVSESVRDIFEYISKDSWQGDFPEEIELPKEKGKPQKKQVKRQSKKIKPIYDYFASSIEAYDKKKLSYFLKSLYNSYVVRINIHQQEEAFSIFERTNARGLDLAASDLLKNHLFSKGGDKVDEKWGVITENADGTILRMLKYFYVSRKGSVSKSQLYKDIKAYCGAIGIERFLEELINFSEFYKHIQNTDEIAIRDYLEKIGCTKIAGDEDKYPRIFNSIQGIKFFKVMQVYPLIFSAIHCFVSSGNGDESQKAKQLINFFELIEKYHFINNAICTRVGNEVENLYADYCVLFQNSNDFAATLEDLKIAMKKKLASKDEFVTNFADIAYSKTSIALIAYIFDRVTNFNASPSQRLKMFNPDPKIFRKGYNVEHFYPQRPNASAKIDSEDLDNIGNLLVISLNTNSKLGNKLPHEKMDILSSGDGVWNLSYIKQFVSKYSEYKNDWNKEVISMRARDLAEQAYTEVWAIK